MNTDLDYKDCLIGYHEGYRHIKQTKRINNHNKLILSLQVSLSVLMTVLTIGLNVVNFKEGVLPIVVLSIYGIYTLQTKRKRLTD